MGLLARIVARLKAWLGHEPAPGPVLSSGGEVPQTIEQVIARMRAIDAELPREDGVAWFNRMYMTVTEDVLAASADHEFEDPLFLERLDVVFANLYFKALDDYGRDPQACSRAWVPLIQTRANRRIAPIQFALAGMNAHINLDLVIALVETCKETDRRPETDSAAHRDFLYINGLLARAQEKVEPFLKRGPFGIVDRIFGRADEALEMWSIERARQAAWIEAQALWALRQDGTLSENYLLALSRTVGFAGRGLLIERYF